MNTRLSVVSFGVKQIKLSDFGQDFQHSFKTTFHLTRVKLCGYRLSLRNLQFIFHNRNLSENWLGGRNWTLSVQTIFWGNLMPLRKIFEANSGLWALKLQKFDKHFGTVVRTATDLSWGVFEGTYFCKRRSLKFVFQHSAKTLLFWQHFLARLSKVHSSFPQEHFQSLYFCMKAQKPILIFGMNQNNSFLARRLSARLAKLRSTYSQGNFALDDFNQFKY